MGEDLDDFQLFWKFVSGKYFPSSEAGRNEEPPKIDVTVERRYSEGSSTPGLRYKITISSLHGYIPKTDVEIYMAQVTFFGHNLNKAASGALEFLRSVVR